MKDSKLTYLFIFTSFLLFSFLITGNWFLPDCTLTTHGDLENHFLNSLGFQEQLINYGFIYPVSFNYFSLGYYQFSYSSIPFLLPLIFRLFMDARTAFFIMYNLLYALGGFFLFILLRRNKGSLIGSFLFSCLFMASGFMNQQFTVHGSYHTIAAIPSFFLTIICLQKCVDEEFNQLNLSLFIIFSALTMVTHFFMLVILSTFITFYLVVKKRFKLWLFFLMSVLLTSFYYVPLFFQSLLLPGTGSGFIFNAEKLSNTFLFSLLIPEIESIHLTASSDFFYGPYFFVTFIIALSYVFHRKKGFKAEWLFLSLIISLIIVTFLCSTIGLLDRNVPFDRITFFFQMSLFLFSAFVFARFKYGFEAPLLIILFNFFPNEEFLSVLSFLVVAGFIVYFFSKKKLFFNRFIKDYLIAFVVLFISIIPLTLFIPNSLNYPRAWCVYFDDVSFIKPSDVVMFDERFVFRNSLVYLTGARTVNNIGHTTLLNEIPSFDNREVFYEFLNRSGVSKWVFLSKKTDDSLTFNYRSADIDFKAVSLIVEPVPYFLQVINPINLKVRLREELSSLTLRLNYHPWWRAFSDNQELVVSQDDWFVKVSGLTGVDEFALVFDMSYFIIGALISIFSLALLVYLVRQQ